MRLPVPLVAAVRRLRPALLPAVCVAGGVLGGVQAAWNIAVFPGPVFGIFVALVLLRLLAGHVARHPDRRVVGRFVTFGVIARLALAGVHLFIGLVVYRGAVDFVGYVGGARDLIYRYIPSGNFAPFDRAWVIEYYQDVPSLMTIMSIATMMLFTGDSVVGLFIVTATLGAIGAYLYFRAYEIACPDAPGRRFFMLAIFLLPSVGFWSIFLGKDVFVFVGLSTATYAFAQALIRGRWRYLPLLGAGLALVFMIRPPITVGFTAAAVAAMIIRPWRWRGPDAYLVPIQRIVVAFGLVAVAYGVAGEGLLRVGVENLTLEAIADRAASQQQGFASTEGGSALPATLKSGDPLSVALFLPFGMFTVLFRPFVWEAHNALALVAGIENIFLMALVLWRLRAIGRSLAAAVRQPFWAFVAISFVALTVAVSFQWNLGASARLRMMGFPFLLLLAAGPVARRTAGVATQGPAPAAVVRLRPFHYYGYVIWRTRWALVSAAVVAGVVSFALTFTLPKVYAAKVTATPPRPPAGATAGTGAGLTASGSSLAAAVATGDPDLFRAVLRSRRVVTDVLDAFEKRRGLEARARILRIVPDDLTRRMRGAFVLTVDARDPALAAEVANDYIEGLNRILRWHGIEMATQQHDVYMRQLERAAREVERVERALLAFQDKHRRLVVGDAQRDSPVGVQVRAEIRNLELQRELLRMRFTDAAPEVKEITAQIDETKRRYAKLLYGHPMRLPPVNAGGVRPLEFFVPGAEAAPVDFEFRKLALDLRLQETFYAGALQGLQDLAYGQIASFGRVEILDPAIPPTTHIYPDPFWIVLGAVIGTLVAGALIVLALDALAFARLGEREALPA